MPESVIYVSHKEEHIKLLQHEPNGMVYLRSIFGEELLLSSDTLCDLLAHWFDKLALKSYLDKENEATLSEEEKGNLEALKVRINEYSLSFEDKA